MRGHSSQDDGTSFVNKGNVFRGVIILGSFPGRHIAASVISELDDVPFVNPRRTFIHCNHQFVSPAMKHRLWVSFRSSEAATDNHVRGVAWKRHKAVALQRDPHKNRIKVKPVVLCKKLRGNPLRNL